MSSTEFLLAKLEFIQNLRFNLLEQLNIRENSTSQNQIENIRVGLKKLLEMISCVFNKSRAVSLNIFDFEELFIIIEKLIAFMTQGLTFERISCKFFNEIVFLERCLSSVVLCSESDSTFETLPSDVELYLKTGESLKGSQKLLELKNCLQNDLIHDSAKPSMYVAIIGPSYMGKTQTAHSLAHLMNVLYVNFSLCRGENDTVQSVYFPFKSITKKFVFCIMDDLQRLTDLDPEYYSHSIRDSEISLTTLGFLFYLIARDRTGSVADKMLAYINLNNILFFRLSVQEFNSKLLDLGVSKKDFVVFIDELISNPQLTATYIKILRNICRAVDLPVILSGTNAKVQNLVAVDDAGRSRKGEFGPWVQVVTSLPEATLQSIGPSIKFFGWNLISEHVTLDSFADENDRCKLDCEQLLKYLLNVDLFTPEDVNYLQDLLEFTFKQSRTNLPGIAIISFQCLINMILALRPHGGPIDRQTIWSKLLLDIETPVLERKDQILNLDGHIASAHLLTFPSVIKEEHEIGKLAGAKVDSHLFHFGRPGDSQIFCLHAEYVKRKNQALFKRNSCIWDDHCFFPSISDDFFSHAIAWQSWYSKFDSEYRTFTISSIYQSYLDNFNEFYVSSSVKLVNGYAFELVAHWSACYASHVSVNGEVGGTTFASEFVNNLQGLLENTNTIYFDPKTYPDSLLLLLSRVKIPYLVSPDSFNCSDGILNFMKLGQSWRPLNKVGWDVIFDSFVGSVGFPCLIECKLWSRAVDIALIYKYYKKAHDLNCPITFLVVRSFQKSLNKKFDLLTEQDVLDDIAARLKVLHEARRRLKGEDEVEEEDEEDDDCFNENEAGPAELSSENYKQIDTVTETVVDSENKAKLLNKRIKLIVKEPVEPVEPVKQPVKQPVKPVSRRPTIGTFSNLFKNSGDTRINIYTILPIAKKANNVTEVSFIIRALKEFENPTGAFIIVASSFVPVSRYMNNLML